MAEETQLELPFMAEFGQTRVPHAEIQAEDLDAWLREHDRVISAKIERLKAGREDRK